MKKVMLSSGLMAAIVLSSPLSAQQIPPQQPQGPIAQAPQQAPQIPVAAAPSSALPAPTQGYPAPMQVQTMQVPVQQIPVQQIPVQSMQAQQMPVTAVPVATVPTSAPPQLPPSSLPPLPSDFQLGVQQNLPISPNEIRQLRNMLDARQKAATEMPNPPKSVTGSVSVSLDPGSSPAVIRPFYGVSTSLVLLDSTGAPWPVENFNVGNKDLFEIERLDGQQGSSFVISPKQAYGQSNLIIKLLGHPTPVVINLISGQRVHDARVEARVLGRGPNAQVTSMSLTPGVDSRLLSVLDGVPPTGRSLKVRGDNASRAWVMPNGRVWLRTGLNVVSPAPISFVSSSDGTRVYELSPSAKVLGMFNDQFVTLELDGCLQECGVDPANQGWND